MQVLIIGGTGLISTGIVKHLLARGADVTMFNRGKRPNTLPPGVHVRTGDRNDLAAFERECGGHWDVVIDMICFEERHAEADIRLFANKCEHLMFCSTVCTYGVKVPSSIFIDEQFPQEPISDYGRNKVLCEKAFTRAHQEGKFKLTIIRPSHTYGPGGALIDNLEGNAVAWDRIERGLPVLCAGDGLGLWVSTHRDDVGKLFAYGALNPRTYGQAYNATHHEHRTWRDYYLTVGGVLGKPVSLIFMPADWITRHDPKRFGLLRDITAFHGAYDASKARRDVPEFTCEISLARGAAETLADARAKGTWRSADGDEVYERMVGEARAAGMEPVEV